MRRACFVAVFPFLISSFWLGQPRPAAAQPGPRVQWIWHNEGDPAKPPQAGSRFFRRVIDLKGPIDPPLAEAVLDVAATAPFTLWVNGVQSGTGAEARHLYTFDIRKFFVLGVNVLAIEVKQGQGKAGLAARLAFIPNGQSRRALVSDGDWRSAALADKDWQKAAFKDAGWQPVRVLGPLGKDGPIPDFAWEDRFTVPPGFRVLPAVRLPDYDPNFSLVNMTFDDRGRLLVSREGKGVFLCTDPDKDGVLQNVRLYCEQVVNCQGMCWVRDALLLVGDGPQGTGLYRVRDTQGQDSIDEVRLLHRFRAGMGEHGPHAIIHGPDGWLYLCIGNHAWTHIGLDAPKNSINPARLAFNSPLTRWPTGGMGPDQGKPGTTEDVLLPRMNDSRGHAANILAPGGTIWRLDHEGQSMSLVAAGFRNHFDAAFSPDAELFTFDSDMEWDENLPWYRAVRVCQCTPGADFVWRTGSANTPNYYLDSLPPLYETGRGSPVGLEFYDHTAFPEQYHGAYLMADWAIGVIFAVHLERTGATYKAKVERFCTGAPMNVTDLAVGPDGAVYFVMGGRGTQGGVYRIVHDGPAKAPSKQSPVERVLNIPQPLSAWSRARQAHFIRSLPQDGNPLSPQTRLAHGVAGFALDPRSPVKQRIRALDYLQRYNHPGRTQIFLATAQDPQVQIRAYAVWLLGVNESQEARPILFSSLKDADALVRRRACEALLRAGIEPTVDALWPLLGEDDPFVRHAARLLLERMEPAAWVGRLQKFFAGGLGMKGHDQAAWQAIIALCHTNRAGPHADVIYDVLRGWVPKSTTGLLDYLRTVQMAQIHAPVRSDKVKFIAAKCYEIFPHPDPRVNRELAILLTHFQREGQLERPVVGKLYQAVAESKQDRQQAIHYFYCLRLLKDGWGHDEKFGLADWYDGTRTWQGGHSFGPFLENIFREVLGTYTLAERKELLERAETRPLPALVLASRLQIEPQPELFPALQWLADRLSKGPEVFRGPELKQVVLGALLKTMTTHPTPESWPYLVNGLASANPLLRSDSLRALRKLPAVKPKAEDGGPYRSLLAAAAGLSPQDRWEAVELLRQWNGRSFGAAKANADAELPLWAQWFSQTFPKLPPLPNVAMGKASQSKYKITELLPVLDKAAAERKGDIGRGRAVFAKASCFKCHKHGKDGEGVGPDLTTLAKRFKRADILEAILEPSKVISDQYRSTTLITHSGQQITGLTATNGDTVTVVLSDASKVMLKRNEIESQLASLISVMPEQLLDPLSLQEIMDLFAFLEAEPKQP
jgi:putative heme-binding domain-containing protein